MRMRKWSAYLAVTLVLGGLVYHLGASSARGQSGGEVAVALTPNLMLSSSGRVFVKEVRNGNLPLTWREFGSIHGDVPAVAMVEYRGAPFPLAEVLTADGSVYQISDDGSGVVRVRYEGNAFGVFRESSVTPKVIQTEEDE